MHTNGPLFSLADTGGKTTIPLHFYLRPEGKQGDKRAGEKGTVALSVGSTGQKRG